MTRISDTITRISESNGGVKAESVLFHTISDTWPSSWPLRAYPVVIASLPYRHCERSVAISIGLLRQLAAGHGTINY